MLATTDAPPLTVKEAARRLSLSVASVYALCAARKLRHQRVGAKRMKILVPADAVEEYLAAGTVGAVSPAAPTAPPVPIPPPRPRHLRMKTP